ncbi:oligosaccharyltransferase complex subunit epsilon [Malassezia cuniculi]|uniref:Dolichyl-diphosphooligosaccharide--protein glycosyltransferase subunit OST2 n=1 Tax=Malassezia cuniculi TaxID=948313 RepID=A0AAF0EYY8_9BASI|nr:oligosaccharyltransferase complex subunit epsilon [Malassezia cuniculi]
MAPRKTQSGGIAGAYNALVSTYAKETPSRLKLIDALLLFLVVTGVAQFVYCILLSDYPFNSFLAGYVHRLLTSFAATVGQFVLALSLRMQTSPNKSDGFPEVNANRAFLDFVITSVVLHFFVVNFLG